MEYIIHLVIIAAIYAMLAMSLNLVVGYTGLLSVTHAAFYGIGAYATALLMMNFGFNFFIAMISGIILAMILSFIAGAVLSKFRGDYYALASLGLNVIIFSIFLNWKDLTRGPLGIPGIPKPEIFGLSFSPSILFLVLALVFLAATYYVSRFIVNSSFGRVLKAIREDEGAIQVFGYNTLLYKLAVFVISAGLAAVAGSLFASYISFIDAVNFALFESILILAAIILGGLANLKGSILGAVFLVLLPELLRFVGFPDEIAAHLRFGVYGLLLVLLMLYRPQGLMGEYKL